MRKKLLILIIAISSIISFSEDFTMEKSRIQSGLKQAKANIKTTFVYNKSDSYNIYGKLGYLTAINLNKDEEIIFIGAGDTSRWGLETVSTPNGSRVYIKPFYKDIKTNITIQTDKREYNLLINSSTNQWNSVVEFDYPQQKLEFKKNKERIKQEQAAKDRNELTTVNTESINFRYKIYSRKLEIAPTQVFDDGNKTFFVMKDIMQEAPSLFLKDGKDLKLVNYRVKNNYYIVDRLGKEFILKLGKKSVKIKKK